MEDVTGFEIDNTTPEEINAWLKAIGRIRPSEVMIYTISRDTPEGGQLNKVPARELRQIADMVEQLVLKRRFQAEIGRKKKIYLSALWSGDLVMLPDDSSCTKAAGDE